MSEETDSNEADPNAEGKSQDDAAAGDDWGDALAEQDEAEKAAVTDAPVKSTGEASVSDEQAIVDEAYQTAEFQNLQPDAGGTAFSENIDIILDIPVTISMEIGRTIISIRNLLQLNQGSVIELDRLAGEPMDVMVNGTLIAHGEVVVVNEKFGIRLTDVISPSERVKKLK